MAMLMIANYDGSFLIANVILALEREKGTQPKSSSWELNSNTSRTLLAPMTSILLPWYGYNEQHVKQTNKQTKNKTKQNKTK